MNWFEQAFPKDVDRPGCWLRWLAETDHDEAKLLQNKGLAELNAKRKREAIKEVLCGTIYEKTGKPYTQGQLEMVAELHPDVIAADKEKFEAQFAHRELSNQRGRVEMAAELWRTDRADKRATAKGT